MHSSDESDERPAAAAHEEERVWEEDLEILAPHYGIDDVPPPAETLLYAWQHTLVDVSPYVLPLIVAAAVGYSEEQAAAMISACLVLMGIATFVNATWGNRLPSVLGPSATDTGAMATAGAIFGAPAMWMAGFVGGLFETVVGASGVLRSLRRFLPPYVCGIVVLTIGVSLARVAGGWVFADTRPEMLGLAAAAVALHPPAHGDRPPVPDRGARPRGASSSACCSGAWGSPALLGLADFAALARAPVVRAAAALRLRRARVGWQLAAGAVIGVVIGYVGSIAESIGDYAGTCAVSGVTYRMRHIHRGITVEGIASAIGPLFGALPLTTYSQNTGVIATTRVASRRVVQVAARSCCSMASRPSSGALLVLIPRPIVGAVFLVICGMIATAGLRLLACGQKDEAFLVTTAVSLIAALTLPPAAGSQKEWLAALSPTARLFLSNGVVIAITLGIGLNAALRAALRSSARSRR